MRHPYIYPTLLAITSYIRKHFMMHESTPKIRVKASPPTTARCANSANIVALTQSGVLSPRLELSKLILGLQRRSAFILA
jgi:hypothetical protein